MPYFFEEITVRDCMLTCSKKKKTKQGKSLKTTFLVVKQILFEKKWCYPMEFTFY